LVDCCSGPVFVNMITLQYLSEGTPLVKQLMTMTRELRHTGVRIIISTQGKFITFVSFAMNTYPLVEPTCVPSVLLDLCGVAIMHRFSSPAWWTHVSKHFSGNFSLGDIPAFDRIVTLKTGEAIILAPSAFIASDTPVCGSTALQPLGQRYFFARTRDRVTKDGGASVLVL
jgi:hypothetical protein